MFGWNEPSIRFFLVSFLLLDKTNKKSKKIDGTFGHLIYNDYLCDKFKVEL